MYSHARNIAETSATMTTKTQFSDCVHLFHKRNIDQIKALEPSRDVFRNVPLLALAFLSLGQTE